MKWQIWLLSNTFI